MFKVRHWKGDIIETVYAAQEREYESYGGKKQCTEFLIYNNYTWMWVDAEDYQPVIE
jgi:hypothetical protein